MLRRGNHNNFLLQSDWKEYGEDNFEFKVLFRYDSLEESIAKEQELINGNKEVGYNIGDSVSGGDLFSLNPRKEDIRKIRKEQMKGENNHQFGKPKTQRMINSVKEANSKRIIIDGVTYNSLTEASQQLSVKINTISYRLRSKTFTNWKYDDDKSPTTSDIA